MSIIGSALLRAGALSDRGVEDLTATLVARAGVATFTTAFGQWVESGDCRDFRSITDEALGLLVTAVCGAYPRA